MVIDGFRCIQYTHEFACLAASLGTRFEAVKLLPNADIVTSAFIMYRKRIISTAPIEKVSVEASEPLLHGSVRRPTRIISF